MRCRSCNSELDHLFVSLGMSPFSNAYLRKEQLQTKEIFYPLDVFVCEKCYLVQLPQYESPDTIFSNYAYFSSYSDTWLKHAQEYVDKMINSYGINELSRVVEIASNDGYLLQYFHQRGISVLGIEPARNVADAAQRKGIPTEVDFFGVKTATRLASKGMSADLLLGNNVLAHVPDLNDFVEGLRILLKQDGIITMEFPHLFRLVEGNQFDTIYHEHFSYFSFMSVRNVFESHALSIFDVEELPSHGGSLRIYACHREDRSRQVSLRVHELHERERRAGYAMLEVYGSFKDKVEKLKHDILDFLINAKKQGKIVVGYGAPAKGNTLLNYCGIRNDFINYTVDKNPHKQGCYLPGTHIYIDKPERIRETKPDYVFILPWNIKDEIMEQMSFIREWGGRFVIPIPKVSVV